MKRFSATRLLLLFLLPALLLPLRGGAQEAGAPAPGLPLPTVVYLSLPACVSAALENPERAEKLFSADSRPRSRFLYQLEKEIEKEVRTVAGRKEAEEALRLRKQQNLISKIEYLYLKANDDPRLMNAFLKLNGLAEDLPARADDNVCEILSSRLWMPDPVLVARTLRQRPEARLRNSSVIKLLIRIQLDLALALCETTPDTPAAKAAALIELSNIAALPPPEIDCGKAPEPIAGNAEPIYRQTSFPILDLYTDLFHLTDWSPF